MRLKITEGGFVTKRWLKLDSSGIIFCEHAVFTKRYRAAFGDVICILMSPDHRLSIQLPDNIFTIATKPHKQQHQETIKALVREVYRAHLEKLQRLQNPTSPTVSPQPKTPPIEQKNQELW